MSRNSKRRAAARPVAKLVRQGAISMEPSGRVRVHIDTSSPAGVHMAGKLRRYASVILGIHEPEPEPEPEVPANMLRLKRKRPVDVGPGSVVKAP